MYENAVAALSDGAVITIVGMLVVFAFLTIMVFAMNVTSKIVEFLNKKFPPKIIEATTAKKRTPTNDDELVAVAIASILNIRGERG